MSDSRFPPSDRRNSTGSRSRREVLRAAGALGVAAATGLAGCVTTDSTETTYRLSARRAGDSLADAFRWEPRSRFPDEDRELMGRLTEEGAMTTEGFSLYSAHQNYPCYAERDGTYYRISVDQAGEVEREHWIFWFDLIEGEPPADAEVFSSSLGLGEQTDLAAEYGLSERDVRVAGDAVGLIPTEFEYRDLEGEPPEQRGHVFVRRSADETDLVPDPPFTHVVFETGDGTRYAQAVAERETVPLQRYDHTAEPVADSVAGYGEHVRERHRRAAFDRATLAEEQRTILDEATGYGPTARRATADASGGRAVGPNDGYEEHPPLSDAMQAVLERLGLDSVETPEPKRVEFSQRSYFEYGDDPFAAQLEIFR